MKDILVCYKSIVYSHIVTINFLYMFYIIICSILAQALLSNNCLFSCFFRSVFIGILSNRQSLLDKMILWILPAEWFGKYGVQH